MSAFVLVHSPLVGPLTFRALAAELAGRGHQVHVPTLRDAATGAPPYYGNFAAAVADQVAGETPVVLVAHSGAGALVPAIVEALRAPVTAAVFVDALLPHGGRSWFDTAPAELGAQLRDLAVDGVLPPWHTWFPPEALAELVPDAAVRAELAAEIPGLPLAYFAEVAPEVPGWQPGLCGYLRLSEPYADAAAEAAARGWRVDHEPSDHLAMLTRPVAVADRVAAFVT